MNWKAFPVLGVFLGWLFSNMMAHVQDLPLYTKVSFNFMGNPIYRDDLFIMGGFCLGVFLVYLCKSLKSNPSS